MKYILDIENKEMKVVRPWYRKLGVYFVFSFLSVPIYLVMSLSLIGADEVTGMRPTVEDRKFEDRYCKLMSDLVSVVFIREYLLAKARRRYLEVKDGTNE